MSLPALSANSATSAGLPTFATPFMLSASVMIRPWYRKSCLSHCETYFGEMEEGSAEVESMHKTFKWATMMEATRSEINFSKGAKSSRSNALNDLVTTGRSL